MSAVGYVNVFVCRVRAIYFFGGCMLNPEMDKSNPPAAAAGAADFFAVVADDAGRFDDDDDDAAAAAGGADAGVAAPPIPASSTARVNRCTKIGH